MFIKTLKPTTPSNRHKKSIKKISSYDRKYSRLLTLLKKNHAGRNNTGRITVRHRGGGHKRIFRSIDSNRTLINSVNTVVRIEYDPNRSSLVALNLSTLGYFYYTLLTEDKKVGDIFISVWSIIDSDLFLHKYSNEGSSMPLIIVPLTSKIHSIESIPSKGSQLIKSAGTYGILIQKYTNGYALVKLPSGEYKFISIFSMGTIGRVSNKKHKQVILGKAGTSRWLGKRPSVRGVAKNPVDHPHGGGEGKSKGRQPVTPWGKYTKGKKTTINKNKYILKKNK